MRKESKWGIRIEGVTWPEQKGEGHREKAVGAKAGGVQGGRAVGLKLAYVCMHADILNNRFARACVKCLFLITASYVHTSYNFLVH